MAVMALLMAHTAYRHALIIVTNVTSPAAPFDYVRLVDGNSVSEGRVEVYHNGQWGTVCGNDWGLADAMVVCHQLGYQRAVGAPEFSTLGEADSSITVRLQYVTLCLRAPLFSMCVVTVRTTCSTLNNARIRPLRMRIYYYNYTITHPP